MTDLKSAVTAAAVEASAELGLPAPDGFEGTAAPAPETPEPAPEPATPAGAETEVEPRAEEPPVEATPGQPGEGTADDVPTSYFGVDLSGLPADQRAEIISGWTERDRRLNTLQREKAELTATKPAEPAPAPAAPEPEPEYPASDADLAEALGLDLEDPDDEKAARTAIPLARTILELKAQVDGIASQNQAASAAQQFTASLSGLEKEYGELPVEQRATFIETAVSKGLDAEAAYWAAVGPTRLAIMQDVTKRLADLQAGRKAESTTPRPSGSVPVEQVGLEAKDTKSAVAEAAALAAKELGIDWDEAWRNRNKR